MSFHGRYDPPVARSLADVLNALWRHSTERVEAVIRGHRGCTSASTRIRVGLVRLAAAGGTATVVMLSGGPIGAAAPQTPAGTVASAIPRTADGKPDFSGIWQAMNTAHWNILPHAASSDGPAGLGVVVGGELPYLPSALAKKNENYRNRMIGDTDVKCLLPGVPRVMYLPYPFQIFQTPTVLKMAFEYGHATRNIYMNSAHPEGPIEWRMGDSRGRWDGDTLVVDVVHLSGETWFDRAGNHHSADMHVVERYTMRGPDHIQYEATIEDPSVFSQPWKMQMILYRHVEPNFQLLEYECLTFLDEAAGNLAPPTESPR